jgi:RHS repeat-associated protein
MDRNVNSALKNLRILGQGQGDIGSAIAIYLSDEWHIPLHDHRGSVIALLGPHPEISTYSAFGEEEESSENPWRFCSKRKDPLTQWIHFGRRDYDPTLGRWMTPDPAGFADGPNLYAYVHNNPLTHLDLDSFAHLMQKDRGTNGF